MSAPTPGRRPLRPRHIRFAAGHIWVVDENQPVAALLDPATAMLDRLVSWAQLPATSLTVTMPLDADVTNIGIDDFPRSAAEGDWYTGEYADRSYNENHRRKRAVGDGVRWFWDQDSTWSTLLIRAFRDGCPTPARALELPRTEAVEGATAGRDLWLIVRATGRSERMLLRMSTEGSGIEFIDTTDDLDISAHCRPIAPEPPDHWSYVRYCIRTSIPAAVSDAE